MARAAGAALKFSRGVLRNSVEFPPVAEFDASRDNDAKHDRRTPGVKADIVSPAKGGEGSIAKVLFRIFLRVLTRCFYLAHFLEIGDFRNRVDRSHSRISHQALPLEPLLFLQ